MQKIVVDYMVDKNKKKNNIKSIIILKFNYLIKL